MKVLIAGAGIGGLTTALMLHKRGIDVALYEAAPEVKEMGVGINILPHAIRELAELDLLPELDQIAIRTSALSYVNRQGQEIWHEARGMGAGYDVPQFSIHRGRLQNMLYKAVLARLGDKAVTLGKRVCGYSQTATTAQLHFEDGGVEKGDVVLGCDGIHSRIRAQMHPNEDGLKWNGVLMWRGATAWPAFGDGSSMLVAGGFRYKLVLYPIARLPEAGKVLMNWVVCYRAGETHAAPPAREDWNRRGTFAELLPHIRAFDTDVIDLEGLVEATEEFFEYPMCDRDALPFWNDGRVTLLGDGAHPMYPVGSNGASQAILDARSLVDFLDTHRADPVAALSRYDAIRRPATAEIVRLNRKGGPEGVIDEVERRAPDGFSDLDAIISPEEREAIVRGYALTAGFTQDQTRLRIA